MPCQQQADRASNGRNDDDAAARAVTAVSAVTHGPADPALRSGRFAPRYPRLMSSRSCQLTHGSCSWHSGRLRLALVVKRCLATGNWLCGSSICMSSN